MEVITFLSGKGGQGKTAVLASVAAGLAGAGKRVLAIDLCYGSRQLDIFMGLENMVLYNIDDVLSGKNDLASALVKSRAYENLYLLSAPFTKDITFLDRERFAGSISAWKMQYDYILIDCPSGISAGFEVSCAAADRICSVFVPDAAGIRGMDKVIGCMEKTKRDNMFMVINMIHPYYIKAGGQLSDEKVPDMFPYPVYAVIPFDPAYSLSLLEGRMIPGGGFALLFHDLCRRITGEEVPFKKWEKYAAKKLK